MRKIKIGFIGTGKIANYHAKAFLKSNFKIEAVAASQNSKRAKMFANKYNAKYFFRSSKELAQNAHKFLDCILICCKTEKSLSYIKLIRKIPILCEKPVSLNYKDIEKTKNKKVFVGYNRRFYNSVSIFKKELKKNKKFIVNVELPEKIFNSSQKKIRFSNVFENSVHMFDLINYIFDEPKLIKNSNLKNLPQLRSLQFMTKKKNFINLLCNWNSSSNFKIEAFSDNKRFLLQPIEKIKIFQGINIINPTKKTPFRQYKPKTIYVSNFKKKEKQFKPGFKDQAEEFYKIVVKNKIHGMKFAKLDDAIKALKIAKEATK